MTKTDRHSRPLSQEEKEIIKYLFIKEKWQPQKIYHYISNGRDKSFNQGRISEVNNDESIKPATKKAFKAFDRNKKQTDLLTGLNPSRNERLVRAREAMIAGISIYNMPGMIFREQNFVINATIAWMHVLSQYGEQEDQSIKKDKDRFMPLSMLIEQDWCPLCDAEKRNLEQLIKLRNDAEHRLLGRVSMDWHKLFQACCINLDNFLVKTWGWQVSLQASIGLALQFADLSIEQVNQTASPLLGVDDSIRKDNKFAATLKIDFTKTAAGAAPIHLQISDDPQAQKVNPENIYTMPVKDVVKAIQGGGYKAFNTHYHILAWKHYNVRPDGQSKSPEKTNKEYCGYFSLSKVYGYSQAWVNFLLSEFKKNDGFDYLKHK